MAEERALWTLVIDQIAATMRDNEYPLMSTRDLSEIMPPVQMNEPCNGNGHGLGPLYSDRYLRAECHGDHHLIVRRPTPSEASRVLHSMARQGDTIEKVKIQGANETRPRIYWKWIGPTGPDLSTLEAMFEVPHPDEEEPPC